jgi:succinate dehydrogenase / fumarate reductase cytochrome b subunit
MAVVAPGGRPRPLSPHLQVWRWHVTLAASILHRAAGVTLYLGLLILAGWALALATGPAAYSAYVRVLGSIPGRVVLFGVTAALFFHMANGLRHLVWDSGAGFRPRTADITAWAAFAFGLIASAAVWIFAAVHGGI